MLRPAGGGIHTVSTGVDQRLALQAKLYGVAAEPGGRQSLESEIDRRWKAALSTLAPGHTGPDVKVVILGIPSDSGAGLVRGAAHGPAQLRNTLLAETPDFFQQPGLLDLGDVISVPQLLEDEMLSLAQLARTRAALYPDLDPAARALWPVSPLDLAFRVLQEVHAINPAVRPVILGGDHSVAWPVVRHLVAVAPPSDLGIVQFDAHTDLLEERLGIRHCFATWSFHANQVLGGAGRLVQIGVRASGHDRAHWEGRLGVRQIWADEARALSPPDLAALVVHSLRAAGVRRVYITNDIDGTDAGLAPATGTPEPHGLHPDAVLEVIRGVGAAFEVVAGDVVEVAPTVGDAQSAAQTCTVAARYIRQTVGVMLNPVAAAPHP